MAEWSSSYVTALPDSAFACVDSSGRHYPHHDSSGKLDLPHLRAALSRIGDASNTQCGKGHLQAHASSAGVGESKAELPMKATVLDDDAFKLLALPFGGPIPYPGAPKGVDLDRQWMSDQTDFGDPPTTVPVTWHHGTDPHIGREVIGKAGELDFDDDGGWVNIWLDKGRRSTQLIRRLADAGADDPYFGIYGSSEAIVGSGRVRTSHGVERWRPRKAGEIVQWFYSGQTLSPAPRNTKSILQPVKATLEDLASNELEPTTAFFDDLAQLLDDLGSNPPPTLSGDGEAKAGRVLAGRNEARLREALDDMDEAYFDPKRRRHAISAIREILDELDKYLTPVAL